MSKFFEAVLKLYYRFLQPLRAFCSRLPISPVSLLKFPLKQQSRTRSATIIPKIKRSSPQKPPANSPNTAMCRGKLRGCRLPTYLPCLSISPNTLWVFRLPSSMAKIESFLRCGQQRSFHNFSKQFHFSSCRTSFKFP